MKGPYYLVIGSVVALPETPAAYILGVKPNNSVYVGRSDRNLRERMLQHLRQNEQNLSIVRHAPTIFWYQEARSAEEAFSLEFTWYAKFAHPCNDAVPARPRPVQSAIPRNW